MRRLLIGLFGLTGTAALAGLGGCGLVDRQSFTDSRTDSATVTEVHIVGGSGRVTLERGGTTVQIDRDVQYAGSRPTGRFDKVENGVLVLATACAKFGCDIDYTVKVPDLVKVTGGLSSGTVRATDVSSVDLSTDSGRIYATRVTGALSVTSDSGAVSASRVDGEILVRTSSGSVHADGLAGARTTVHSDSGSVTLGLAGQQDVTVSTSSGQIRLTVPSGGSWQVRQSTDSGKLDVDVPRSADAAHAIDVSSSSGDISVHAAPAGQAPGTSGGS